MSASATGSMTSERLERRVLRTALAVLVLTSLHHAYGAYIYGTPWRLHVVPVAGLGAAALMAASRAMRGRRGEAVGEIARWTFMAVAFILPIGVVGFFEGGYNHVLKNAVYFAGASPAVMRRLFPPPTYELPGDVFFEVTGVLQFVLAAVTGYYLYLLVRATVQRRADPSRAIAAV